MESMMPVKVMSVAAGMPMAVPGVSRVSMSVPPMRMAGRAMMPVSVSRLSTSDAWAVQPGEQAKNSHHRNEAG